MVQQTSAYDVLVAQYRALGLESLAQKIISYGQEGLTNDEAYIRLRETTEWKERFAGNEVRKAKGLRELTPEEYLSKERAIEEQFARYEVPAEFYNDPADKSRIIGADLGAGELGERLEARKNLLQGELTGVLDYFRQSYGVGLGDLLGFVVDPDRGTQFISKLVEASKIGAAGARAGFGNVSTAEAERLAAMGISDAQAQAGFSQAANLKGLTAALDGDAVVAEGDLTAAVFDDNAAAQQRIQRASDARKARFSGGGQYAESRTGFAGLGSANS